MRYLRFVQLLAIAAMLFFCVSALDLPSLAAGMGSGTGVGAHLGQDRQQTKGTLPVAVDGARTPDRIPDDVAYRLFLTAMALPPEPSPARFEAREAMLTRAGLSSEDRAAFVDGLEGLKQGLDEVSRQRNQFGANSQLSPDARTKYLTLKARETELVVEARSRVERLLSSDGRTRLDAFIRTHVKTRVKIFGDAVQ
jgi:hypothetical protein